ncbi:hypothetical protein [Aureimonas sp. AU12]|uniref:hypothetical protein n=1 Tax=Aureimonas sp. AU12 TaxID=1638161 RepID=UPI0007802C23|nr:hypothetical protein [Aureimonas sp. AU12]
MANKVDVGEIAKRHGFSEAAGQAMADALRSGGGSQAQFSHPDLGGMGQWSKGGMLMISDMFNDELKGRVAALAGDLSEAGAAEDGSSDDASGAAPKSHGAANDDHAKGGSSGNWWPGDLGRPGSSGSQNGVRYAVFPEAHRLAIERDGDVSVHDTGDHKIGGISQQQGSSSTLRFSSQKGDVDLDQLPKV